jgi:hypothetical protein
VWPAVPRRAKGRPAPPVHDQRPWGAGVEGVVRVEDRLVSDVDDRGRDVLMTPWPRP